MYAADVGLADRTAQLPLAREWVGISCDRELRAGTIPISRSLSLSLSLFFFFCGCPAAVSAKGVAE